jgi:class 3 adenylate cyclase/tetratricopeptide (TPR) repeat protein
MNPKDRKMTELESLLDELGFHQYYSLFQDNDIDLTLVADLSLDELKEIGIASLGHRKKLYARFQTLAASDAATDTSSNETADAGLEAERRNVTTVFADLNDYTALSRDLDTEDMHDVLSCFYESLNEIVVRMGGTIDGHRGDCVIAVFGAPVSYGNDTERALRAASEMHRAMDEISHRFGRELTIHVGAAVGNVLFSRRGYGHRKDVDFTLTGDTVNLASRLADRAGRRETLIDHLIYRSLSHKIVCDTPLSLEVKGYDVPILAHRYIGFRETTEVKPLVGRDREMAVMRSALTGSDERGTGETIFVRGDAGLGKTHLLQATRFAADEAGFETHTAQFLDFGSGNTHDPIEKLVKSMCGLRDRARQSAIMVTVSKLVEAEVLTQATAIFAVQMLGGKLDRDMSLMLSAMSDDARTESYRETLRRLLRHFSAQRPQLILVEDIHWADPDALPMVDLLIEESKINPILLLITSRMEGMVMEVTLAPIDSSARVRCMTLEALTESEALALAQKTLRVTEEFIEECVEKAQGNPLFLVQMLAHATDSNGRLPSSIQSLIQARFDRLGPVDKKILQAAAIFGQRFAMAAVTRISGISVYDEKPLVEAALIKPTDDGYLFAHALIREAILQTILRNDFRALHKAAARWYATQDRRLYAQHLAAAMDPEAPEAFLEVAQDARERFQREEALRLADAGLSCAPDTQTKGALLRVKADALRDAGQNDASIECFRSARDCAQTPLEICQSEIGIASAMRILDRIDDAYSVLDHAQDIAEEAGLIAELSTIHYLRGSLHFPRGDLDGCEAEHTTSLDYARRADLPRRQALALSGLGDAAYAQGRMFSAHDVIEKCLSLCHEHDLVDVESANLFMLATAKIYMNETETALDYALRSAELAAQLGMHRPEIVSRLTAGWILTSMARFEDARFEIQSGLDLATKIGALRFEPFLEETNARIAFYEGKRAEAAAIAENALRKLRDLGAETFIGPWVMSTVGLTTPDATRRKKVLAEAEALLAKGCVGHNYFRFYRNAMQACLNAGEHDEAARFADALETYAGEEPTPWSDFHIARTRAMLDVACGRADEETLKDIIRSAQDAALFNSVPPITGPGSVSVLSDIT